ncbi:two pore domain potassium channel family protein [Virgibacillus sp. MSJ-26]|uniref:potassium channel family protein n=1 Tax=Virgibacillus sp. MSJ-26 TaxID=2841522 RepID=UPI001C12819E|nr:potassium channel family protein [Virgibacillus sp. MSJ-26]MBU5468141.1 two pore domain potassium channel family protein [Virgibacillus sp. MSJ-26]
MAVLSWIFIGLIVFILIKSLTGFIKGGSKETDERLSEGRFSVEIFYTLLVTYTIVILGFGLIYFILSLQGIILVEGDELRKVGIIGSLVHSFYFSGVTMLTIGYGDIVPIGIGRLVALIQALIGYVLPTAFVLRLVVTTKEKVED